MGTLATELPVEVLGEIAAYLPESSVGALLLVCSRWNDEIAESSSFWKRLIERRGWPMPPETGGGSAADDDGEGRGEASRANICKAAFVSLASCPRVLGDLKLFGEAARNLGNRYVNCEAPECTDAVKRGIAAKRFFTRKHVTKKDTGEPVAVRVFSPTMAIAAYENGWIRMIEAVGTNPIDSSVDTLEHVRYRENGRILGMDLDDYAVGFLIKLSPSETVLRTTTKKDMLDDYFFQEEIGIGNFEDIRPSESFVLETEIIHHLRRWQGIQLPLSFPPVENVQIRVLHTLVACGDGDFLVAAELVDGQQAFSYEAGNIFTGWGMFSTRAKRFLWMNQLPDCAHLPTVAAGLIDNPAQHDGPQTKTRVALSPNVIGNRNGVGPEAVITFVFDTSHQGFMETSIWLSCQYVVMPIISGGFELSAAFGRPTAVLTTGIVAVADTIRSVAAIRSRNFLGSYRTIISVMDPSLQESSGCNLGAPIHLPGDSQIVRMTPFGDNLLLVVDIAFNWEKMIDDERFDPHQIEDDPSLFDEFWWNDHHLSKGMSLRAIVIDVKSKRVMGSTILAENPLIDTQTEDYQLDMFSVMLHASKDGLAAVLRDDGMLFSGPGTKRLPETPDTRWEGVRLQWGIYENEHTESHKEFLRQQEELENDPE